MHTSRLSTLALCTLLATLAACKPEPKETAPRTEVSQSAASQEFVRQTEAPKADGTVGMLLPDFAQLVAREGGSVVNIQALRDTSSKRSAQESADIDAFSDFFKRIIPDDSDGLDSDNEANFGSGVIISEDGYILTNTHVVKDMDNIKITLNDKREYPAKLIGADEKSDIALLKIDAADLPVAKLGNPSELKSGEWVAAIGAPFGFDNSVTAGIVSAKNRTLPNENYTPFIQTDVAINPGNSGGALFNLRGQVVGINSQIYSRSGGFMGISFAIPIDVAMNVAEQLKATGRVQRGQLGVMIQEVSYNLAKSFGLDKPTGALISKVMPDSPAAKAGLQVGDIIRSVNGEEVRSSGDLPLTIGSIAPGKDVQLGIWRKGEQLNLTVTLAQQDSAVAENEHSRADNAEADNDASFTLPDAGLGLVLQTGASGESSLVVTRATGAAARAGLRRGDVIVEVGGVRVNSQESLAAAFKQAGNQIPLLVQRGGNSLFLALMLP